MGFSPGLALPLAQKPAPEGVDRFAIWSVASRPLLPPLLSLLRDSMH